MAAVTDDDDDDELMQRVMSRVEKVIQKAVRYAIQRGTVFDRFVMFWRQIPRQESLYKSSIALAALIWPVHVTVGL